MKNSFFIGLLIFAAFYFVACDKEPVTDPGNTLSGEVTPVDITQKGFDLLENMQGHWIGYNQVLSWEWDWFAFDYRPVSESHIFGIFEGGSQGNLLTSFFVTDFKSTRTIMARNGGVLSGIYRTSYFVLDSVRVDANGSYYRLVDAVGGASTMYMELMFHNDSLNWNAYTSRLGENVMPTRHMTFKGKKEHIALANTAASNVGFPNNVPAWDFSGGFDQAWLYDLDETTNTPQSATYAAQQNNNDVYTLAVQSGDPFTITDHPYLASLQVNIVRNTLIDNQKLLLYLSKDPLTDSNGFFSSIDAFNTILLFPSLTETDNDFLITYLHPGDYYVTIVADINGDGIPSNGDITHVTQPITINQETQHNITINNITVQN